MNFPRLLCALAPLVAALGCSSGGGSSTSISVPAWEKFRHDSSNTGQSIGAFTTVTPHVKWTAQIAMSTPTPLASPAAPDAASASVMSSPVVALDGTVYVASQSGTLAAVDPSGNVRWRVTACGGCTIGPVVSSPAVYTLSNVTHIMVASVASAGTSGGVFLFSSSNGNEPSCDGCFVVPATCEPDGACSDTGTSCTQNADCAVMASFISSPAFITNAFTGNISGIFVGAQIETMGTTQMSGRVYALNGDASLQWEFPPPGNMPLDGPVNSSIAIGTANTLYFAAGDGNLYGLNPSGMLLVRQPIGAAVSDDSPLISSLVTNATIYGGTVDGIIFARNPDSALPVWRVPAGDALIASVALGNPALTPTPAIPSTPTDTPTAQSAPTLTPTPLLSTLQVFGVTRSGMVIAIDTTTGNILLRHITSEIVGPIISSPALTIDGILVFGDSAGKLHAIRTDDGSELPGWLPMPALGGGLPITSSPAIGTDGTVYIVGGDGVLYAVSTQ